MYSTIVIESVLEVKRMGGFNLGDALFQLVNIGFIVLIIIVIVSFFRSTKSRRNQLDRIEKKIDDMNEQMKKGKIIG